jgi:hypothetical protein
MVCTNCSVVTVSAEHSDTRARGGGCQRRFGTDGEGAERSGGERSGTVGEVCARTSAEVSDANAVVHRHRSSAGAVATVVVVVVVSV